MKPKQDADRDERQRVIHLVLIARVIDGHHLG